MAANNPSQAVAAASEPLANGNRLMALDLEAIEHLQSQVILPFSLGSTIHAILGPLLTPFEV